MTKITLENKYTTVSVTVPNDDLNSEEITSKLLEPLLLAVGYHPETVAEIFGEEIQDFKSSHEADEGEGFTVTLPG